jgi:hypothetical protein
MKYKRRDRKNCSKNGGKEKGESENRKKKQVRE